jgi:hypothetical protein
MAINLSKGQRVSPLPTPPPHDPRPLLHRRSPKANSFQTDKLQSILQAEGLEHLIPTLVEQGIVDSMLADLTESDLKSLGIDKFGERKRLLAVLANHRSAEQPSPKEQRSPTTRTRSAPPARRANRVQTDKKAETSPSSSDYISIGCGTLSVIVFIMGVFYSLYSLVCFLFFK